MAAVPDGVYDDAIRDRVRWPARSLRADWNRDGLYTHPLADLSKMIVSVEVDRSLEAALPPELSLVEGHAASSLSVQIRGRWDGSHGQDPDGAPAAFEVFAPFRVDSPFYGWDLIGTPIVLDSGFLTEAGARSDRLFTGVITRIGPGSRDRQVSIDALDLSSQLRAPIYQTPIGLDSLLLARWGPTRYNARFNTQGPIDKAFRANGYFASPPPQPNPFLSATMHGWSVPEIGGGGVPQQVSYYVPDPGPAWVADDHPYGMLYPNPAGPPHTGTWTADVPLSMFPGTGFGCSFLIRIPDRPLSPLIMATRLDGGPVTAGIEDYYGVLVTLEASEPTMYFYTPGSGLNGVTVPLSLPTTPTWHFVGMHWSFGVGTCTMQMNLDGIDYVPLELDLDIGAVRANPWAPSTTIGYEFGVPVTNVSWFESPVAPLGQWVGPGHVSQVDIDPGVGELYGIPQVDGEESLPFLTELAAAEAANVGVSTAGRPFFRSRAVLRPHEEPEVLSAALDLTGLGVVTDEASVRNSISSSATPLLVGDYEWIVEADDITSFESGPGTSYFDVPLPPDTVLVDPWAVLLMNGAAWEKYADNPYYRVAWQVCAVTAADPFTAVNTALIDLALFPKNAGAVTLVVYNYTSQTIRFQTEDTLSETTDPETGEPALQIDVGTPAFRLPGRKLAAAATVPQNIHDPGSIAKFGQRTHDLGSSGGSRWYQYAATTAGIGEGILGGCAYPVPVFDTVEARHDPRRELGQQVLLSDPRGMGEARSVVTGIRPRFAGTTAHTDELVVRPLSGPGFGLLGDEVLGTVGGTLRFGA